MIMKVRHMGYCDINDVSVLHKKYINAGFLSSLGEDFLKLIYKSVNNSSNAFCFVAEEDGKIVGFVSGVLRVGDFYKEFLKNNFFMASVILIPKIINIRTIKKVFETLFYPMKKKKSLTDAELLSMVVGEGYQGKGVGQKLFDKLVEEFKRQDVKQFKVVVGAKLTKACKFYGKMGLALHSEIEVHKGELSKIYVWKSGRSEV